MGTVESPKNAIVILLDSLNRHMLGAYGGTEFATPNLDRFARRALRFEVGGENYHCDFTAWDYHLYNLRDDPAEEQNLAGSVMEKTAADHLRAALEAIEAPDDQYVRLGLA